VGFLDELIKTIQEAVDEANGQAPRPVATARPAPSAANTDDVLARERLRRRYEEARHAQSDAEKNERARIEAQHRAEAVATAAASAPAVATARSDHPLAASSADRLGHILRQRQTAREAFLVSEVFGRPLSQRPHRGR